MFKVSTFEAATSGINGTEYFGSFGDFVVSESMNPQQLAEVQNAEQLLKRRLPIGSHISTKSVIDDFTKQVKWRLDVIERRREYLKVLFVRQLRLWSRE